MARIIKETSKEYTCRCSHCFVKIAFSIEDVFSSYVRGLELGDGWIDCDCVWHYIKCPKCNNVIDVKQKLSNEDDSYLSYKYKTEDMD